MRDALILPTRRTRELKTKRKTKKQRRLCLVQQKTIPLGKHVDNIGQHLVFIAGQLLNSCWGCHRNTWRWLAPELRNNSSPQSNVLSRPGSLCRFLRSDRISKASTTWQHGKTVENLYLTKVHKPLTLPVYQTWDSSSATRNFKKTNWPSETLLRCRPCLDVWPKPAGDKLHGFVHLWHDGWRPRLCRGWDPRTPWHEWIRGDSRNRSQRSQE